MFMADRGAFEGVDAAMMVHPADGDLTTMNAIAVDQLWVDYRGRAAHAAAFPEKGRNALDAAVLGYVNVAALRQHIGTEERVHGIFPDAGDKPNIVPHKASAHWYVRSPNLDPLAALEERVLACLEAGADAAGCEMDVQSPAPVYAELVDNPPLDRPLPGQRGDALGRRVRDGRQHKVVGQHRHGQRQPSRPDDPPHDQGLPGRRAHPHGRVRRVGGRRAGRQGRPRRRQGDGHDHRRPVVRRGPSRRTPGRAFDGGDVGLPRPALDRSPNGRARATRTLPPMSVYVGEEFTSDEQDILRRYFTNLDGPVFALVNLPEVVKGALFARYSRSPKSLRRLFLDEFVGDLDITGDITIDATVGLARAEQLYDRVFYDYGDDSVAQLGGVHLACEQASNVLTKVLEWGRLAAYLEQSTRYIAYDARLGGRYRYYRDPDVLGSAPRCPVRRARWTACSTPTPSSSPPSPRSSRSAPPRIPDDSDFIYRQAMRAKAFDALRGILPAASLSNVGIYATGQAYEQMLLRMRAHPLPEARSYAELMLTELRKVIPSFLKRVDVADRGLAWSRYLADTREAMEEKAAKVFPDDPEPDDAPLVRLVDFDPDGETKMLAAMLYPYVDLPEDQITPAGRGHDHRGAGVPGRGLCGRPGQPATQAGAGTGAHLVPLRRPRRLRRLPRPPTPPDAHHRVAAVEPPPRLHPPRDGRRCRDDRGVRRRHGALRFPVRRPGRASFPVQASYAVALAYKVRFVMQLNARSAMHLIELRSTPQGHPAYRRVAQEMHRLIAEQAGHHAVAEAMAYVDHSGEQELERLDSERRAEQKRTGL